MPKNKNENVRFTVLPCFCGEVINVEVKDADLQRGVSFVHKCPCGINWNLRLRHHQKVLQDAFMGNREELYL